MALQHYALFYDYVPDFMEKRTAYRDDHLALLKEHDAAGTLVLGGAFMGEPAGAMIIFRGEDDEDVRAFVDADPYVANGIVTNWTIREWNTVVGDDKLPIR